MSAGIDVRGITKRFGTTLAVDNVSLEVRAGEFLTLLGPSGCGKTTLLRLIAGFDSPDAGAILLGGVDVTRLPPQQRDVNQVFQSYALFPHLSVRDNIAFGLVMQRLSTREIAQRIAEVIALVALEGFQSRKPHELSGGQRQRVALARALAPKPAVLLLDEPLSALDARLRHAMQLELKRLQRQVGTTFVLVTHDQEEALTTSDRIALMNRGRIEQLGDVHDVYLRPATAFAAEFMGAANVLQAELVGAEGDRVRVRLGAGLEWLLPTSAWPASRARARLSIRPEKLHLSARPLTQANVFAARVEEEVFRGATDRLVIVTDAGVRFVVIAANESALRSPLHAGDRVWCAIHADDVTVIP
jgi:spermidine/putrescine transport system ATP-binding protein